MEVQISNETLQVRIDTFGAELVGLKNIDTDIEYMWQKDPQFWGKCSPVLFPFIGAIKDNQYSFKNQKYIFTGKHGFAREKEFKIVSCEKNSAEFLLSSDESTEKIYPFSFNFYMKYILDGKTLKIQYRVENLGDEKMYFSLGAHPAFNTPVSQDISYSDYYIEFEKLENSEGYILENSLFVPESSEHKRKFLDKNILNLNEHLFDDDIIIFKNTNSQKIYLKNRKNDYCIRFKYFGFKHIGFWSKPKAPYVCLEPWNGLPDYVSHNGKLEDKKYIEILEPKSTYTKFIEISI